MPAENRIEIHPSLLQKLHRIHRQTSDLTSQIARCPRQIQAGKAMVDEGSKVRDTAKEMHKTAVLACDAKQLQLQSREDKISGLQGKLKTAASNKEFSLLKEQIAADQQANEVLSDEILEGLEHIDQLENEVQKATENLDRLEEEQRDRVKEIEAKQQQLETELSRIESELNETEKDIPSSAMAEYRRITEARGEDALAPVDGESCGGCYQTLTTQLIDRLRMSLLIRCPSCNAFLYTPENRQVT